VGPRPARRTPPSRRTPPATRLARRHQAGTLPGPAHPPPQPTTAGPSGVLRPRALAQRRAPPTPPTDANPTVCRPVLPKSPGGCAEVCTSVAVCARVGAGGWWVGVGEGGLGGFWSGALRELACDSFHTSAGPFGPLVPRTTLSGWTERGQGGSISARSFKA
jgi:hypothetical protein